MFPQAARLSIFSTSSSLVENARRRLEQRGEAVTATREPNWKWWPQSTAVTLVRAKLYLCMGMFSALLTKLYSKALSRLRLRTTL